ncbi:MAG TPA: hypothetical protein VID95_06840 [Candidatus Limnocylindrales bacterium]|jgi:hypothetical protein
MPHVSEVRATDHDRHDLMLVAALAAGDLAGTDRDQAIAQTDSCAECSALHDDLVAIAQATRSVPPPIRGTGRDFRLTPGQAASLHPSGWRRFVRSGGRGAFTRPLGVALATFGIAGILIGTLSLGFTAGSSASAPQPAAAGGATTDRNAVVGDGSVASAAAPEVLRPVPAASAAAASAAAPVASSAAAAPGTGAAGGGFGTADGGVPAASAPTSVGIAAAPSTAQVPNQETTSTTSAGDGSSSRSWSPLLIVSAIALVIGVALLVLARRRENELG